MRCITKIECLTIFGGYLVEYLPPEGNEACRQVAGLAESGSAPNNGRANSSFINVGAAAGALVGGFMAGGPVGFGFALGGLVIATGINGLIHLHSSRD